jgi:hypothetical protein
MITKKLLAAAALPVFLVIGGGCAEEDTSLDLHIDHGVDFPYDPGYDPGFDPGYDPVYDPGYDPGYDPVYDPGYDPVYDPGTCTESPCGLYPNCGCPAGQKCSLDDTGSRACMPAGAGAMGSTCTSDADCAMGYICLGTSLDGSTGACYPFCDSDADCAGDGSICFQLALGETPIDAYTCSYPCDLTTASGCPPGHGCDLYGIDENGDTITEQDFTDCNGEVGSGTQGAYCTSEDQCGTTHVCYLDEYTCLGYCYVGATVCPSPSTCVPLEVYIGSREVGACY